MWTGDYIDYIVRNEQKYTYVVDGDEQAVHRSNWVARNERPLMISIRMMEQI